MIGFLRKLRSKNLEKNNVRSYFLYALGEIILIVIGILIALQISNWNERKKANLLSSEMISELKAGIEGDLVEMEKYIYSQKAVLKSQTIISDWLKGDEVFHDSLSKHLSRTYIATDYSINASGYETLKKFGLRRIENDSLRLSIANLYEVKYPTFVKFSNIYQEFLGGLMNANPGHFNELNYMRATIRPLNDVTLKQDNEYAYHLNSLKNFNRLLLLQGSFLQKEVNQTLAIF